MLNLTNTEINTLIDNALTEYDARADVAAMFADDNALVLTDVSTSDAYTAPVVSADDICTAMKLSTM